MNYLDLTAEQLAWQFLKSPERLLDTFEELFSALELFQLGDEMITHGDEDDEDFFACDSPGSLLEDIEMAMQLARRHCEVINRFCEDIDKGRGPSMKDGIRLLSLVEGGKKPSKSLLAEWTNWEVNLRDYVEFFRGSLVLDWLVSTSTLGTETDSSLLPDNADSDAAKSPTGKSQSHEWYRERVQVKKLKDMMVEIGLSASKNTVTTKVKKWKAEGKIERTGNGPLRIRMDLYNELNPTQPGKTQ